jgi:signal transduction histidine kinase
MTQASSVASSVLDKKHTVIILQWLIAIVTSYLVLFSQGVISEDPWVYALVAVLMASVLVLYRLPNETFENASFDAALLLCDTLLITIAIFLNRTVPWDLFLFYFFILLLAAIGATMAKIVVGSVVISLVYIGLLLQQGKGWSVIGADVVIRIPFLFGVSLLYAYLGENANRERQRAQTAEERERLKMDLVSSLAHDIKNPLGVIMGYAETVSDKLAGRTDATLEVDMLDRIQSSSQRIVNLVTGFLEASKAESGRLKVEHRPLSVNRLLREVAKQQQAEVAKKQLTLKLDLDEKLPDVYGDEAQIDRVFWNLIGNAIKFTPKEGAITVSSSLTDGYVCVAVHDTGMGIPKDELPMLFTQFRRLKGAGKIEGTGLGLFIVKTIIEAHKGIVQADSEEGRGTTFRVHIPIRS